MDDLATIIFIAVMAVLGLVGSKKKKRPPPPPRPAQPHATGRTEQSLPSQARPLPRRDAAEAQSALVRSAQERPQKKRGIAEELLDMLQQRLEIPEAPSAPPESAAAHTPPESLETLEPAGGASHDRFHERYMNQEPAARPYQQHEKRAERLELSRKKLQQAFIMKEIIGPPKGIE